TTPLFSFKDKFRILGEPWRKRGTNPNEKVGELARRRLGKSFLDYAVDPFLSGVYAGDPMMLPTRVALPKLYNLEQNYGSFIRGSIAKAKMPKTERDRKATKKIFSAKDGFGNLIAALAKHVGNENIVLSAYDTTVTPLSDGLFKVCYTDATGNAVCVTSKKVVTTCGAYALPTILPFVEKEDMDKISNLVYAPVVQIGVGIKNVENHHFKAFGGLIPSKEKKNVLGILFPSACFAGRAPEEGEALAFFIGGIRHPEMMDWTDEQFTELVEESLHTLLKYPNSVKIDTIRIFRHRKAIPQYQESTDARYATIDALQEKYPGLIIAGNLRGGIGMADRIRQATEIGNM
ncbi:MAG: protoporphyrinogen oxidase, partial [Bacteroidaceae bacterium]|nr:protoporphyrinogen oxidase [Bacteroidaceae bacterium]